MEPDVIVISDDDDDEPVTSKYVPFKPKIICVESVHVTSPPRIPGRLSLSFGKTNRKVELKPEGKHSITITPLVKVEPKSPRVNLSPAVVTISSCPNILPGSSLIAKEAKLQSIIEKFQKKKETMQQEKAKKTLMLPVPVSGPLEPYQRPENVNEVHSSTGSEEMRNNAITRMFDTCREFSTDKDDQLIIEKMWSRVKKFDSSYTTSQKFLDFTQSVHAKILLESSNMHLYLQEFYDELARMPSSSKQKSKSTKTTSDGSVATAGTSTSHSLNGEHEPDTTSVETGNEKHIERLEKLLKKCSKKVTKLEEKEMSVDDLDDDGSIYILIDRYKKKCLQIWTKLSELNGQKKAQSGRFSEKKFVYEGSRFPEVNKCISRLVNRSKVFPDFCDITELITQCNGQYDLHLRPFQIDTLAREAFKDIGKELKRRRIMDYEEHFGCPVLDEKELENDPASLDDELNAKLSESSKLGNKKAEEIFESFVLKQVELDSQPPNPEATESQNEDESEDDDTEKDAPIDGADDESESESESKGDEVENEVEEEEEEEEEDENEFEDEDENEEVEVSIENELEKSKISMECNVEKEETNVEVEIDIVDEEAGNSGEVNKEKCDVTKNTEMYTYEMHGASIEVVYDDQCGTKRSATPEFSIEPPSKRHTSSIVEEIGVKILNDIDNFAGHQSLDLADQDSCNSEIFIIN